MRAFTIRDIDCEEILPCDDGDVILRHCTGDRLFLHEGYNSLPKKVKFNLRLSKKLAEKIKKSPNLEPLKTKGKMPLVHGVGKKI